MKLNDRFYGGRISMTGEMTCECGRKNSVNARMSKDGKLAISGATVEIGGDDRYTAICRKCYKDKMKEQENEKEN